MTRKPTSVLRTLASGPSVEPRADVGSRRRIGSATLCDLGESVKEGIPELLSAQRRRPSEDVARCQQIRTGSGHVVNSG